MLFLAAFQVDYVGEFPVCAPEGHEAMPEWLGPFAAFRATTVRTISGADQERIAGVQMQKIAASNKGGGSSVPTQAGLDMADCKQAKLLRCPDSTLGLWTLSTQAVTNNGRFAVVEEQRQLNSKHVAELMVTFLNFFIAHQ